MRLQANIWRGKIQRREILSFFRFIFRRDTNGRQNVIGLFMGFSYIMWDCTTSAECLTEINVKDLAARNLFTQTPSTIMAAASRGKISLPAHNIVIFSINFRLTDESSSLNSKLKVLWFLKRRKTQINRGSKNSVERCNFRGI